MPPLPKHPSTRARRNKTSSSATLSLVHNVTAPDLPAHVAWHEMTLAWWADIWKSPMAPEYDDSDRHGLFLLAVLVNDYWAAETLTVRQSMASEIRLQRQCFGLTPMDRRRLQWEIERTDEAQDKGAKRRASAPTEKPSAAADPRAALRPV